MAARRITVPIVSETGAKAELSGLARALARAMGSLNLHGLELAIDNGAEGGPLLAFDRTLQL